MIVQGLEPSLSHNTVNGAVDSTFDLIIELLDGEDQFDNRTTTLETGLLGFSS